ncbi:hypothetical protein B0H14DRAFT_3432436 [Mycena olivaceomarginata]|nr:hypothetical protein B0H14DRAFT_3432436 [Mycena olivaceomarginata]
MVIRFFGMACAHCQQFDGSFDAPTDMRVFTRLGATGVITEFAVKKYRGHRGVLAMELEAASEQWKQKAKMGTI